MKWVGCSLEGSIDFGLDPLLVDERAVHAAGVEKGGQAVRSAELDDRVQARDGGVLQQHIAPGGPPELKGAALKVPKP